jgi:hypothetical protein
MTQPRFSAMTAVTDLRKVSADVVALCDAAIFASEGEGAAALRALPTRIRALISRAQRCLTALETEQKGGATPGF